MNPVLLVFTRPRAWSSFVLYSTHSPSQRWQYPALLEPSSPRRPSQHGWERRVLCTSPAPIPHRVANHGCHVRLGGFRTRLSRAILSLREPRPIHLSLTYCLVEKCGILIFAPRMFAFSSCIGHTPPPRHCPIILFLPSSPSSTSPNRVYTNVPVLPSPHFFDPSHRPLVSIVVLGVLPFLPRA